MWSALWRAFLQYFEMMNLETFSPNSSTLMYHEKLVWLHMETKYKDVSEILLVVNLEIT